MWGVVGQERAVAALTANLARGRPAHAYLLVGPPNVGKHTLALQLAQALNCQGEDKPLGQAQDKPCGDCGQCRRIEKGVHADVQVVTVEAGEAGPHKEIRIAQIREVERTVALKPFEGRSRAVIIDPADAMNVETQNAFLKTLEEPPPEVVFLLVTSHEEELLPTIRSRCQRLELGLLAVARLESALAERGVDAERAGLLARLSAGRIGLALAMAEDPDKSGLLAARAQALERARAVPRLNLGERFALAEGMAGRFSGDRQGVLAALDQWRGWWRDVLLVQSGSGEGATNIDMMAALREDARSYSRQQVVAFLRASGATVRYLADNVNPRLALEALMLEAPRPAGAERSGRQSARAGLTPASG